MPGDTIGSFGSGATIWTLSPEDAARQAVPPLRGYVYQLHQSAAVWLSIQDGAELHLEVAEDYAELIREPGRIEQILRATQVKDTRESGSVTLNSTDVLDAIERLFRLKRANPARPIEMVFLTTSEVGKERKNILPSGRAGLDAWKEAAEDGDIEEVRSALLLRLEASALKTFVEKCSGDQLRSELIAPLKFVCGAPDWCEVATNNRARLVTLRDEVNATVDMAERAYDAVFYQVTTTILNSPTRTLDRAQLIACLKKATSIAVPSQAVEDHFAQLSLPRSTTPIDETLLRSHAKKLLDMGQPPSLEVLFPDAPAPSKRAFRMAQLVRRSAVEVAKSGGEIARIDVSGLPGRPELQQLIVGSPGSGKSHSLWNLGRLMLAGEGSIPIFLPVAGLESWDDAVAMLTGDLTTANSNLVFEDARIVFLIDGWSEFAPADNGGQKQRALRALAGARVIATSKVTELADGAFKLWSLEPFSAIEVSELLTLARPVPPSLDAMTIDLLRLPLLLSMHVLAGTHAGTAGDLLRQFHTHVSCGCPQAFTDALSGAIAALTISGDRSFARFASELQRRANGAGISEPMAMLRQVGTITERNGKALAIHDLYWNWLGGVGLLDEHRIGDAIRPLETRSNIALALQSGTHVEEQDVAVAVAEDVILAAELDCA